MHSSPESHGFPLRRKRFPLLIVSTSLPRCSQLDGRTYPNFRRRFSSTRLHVKAEPDASSLDTRRLSGVWPLRINGDRLPNSWTAHVSATLALTVIDAHPSRRSRQSSPPIAGHKRIRDAKHRFKFLHVKRQSWIVASEIDNEYARIRQSLAARGKELEVRALVRSRARRMRRPGSRPSLRRRLACTPLRQRTSP